MTVSKPKKHKPAPPELQALLFVECVRILVATNKRIEPQVLYAELSHAIQVATRTHNLEKTQRQVSLNMAFSRVRDAAVKLLDAMRELDPEALDDLRISVEKCARDASPEMPDGTLLKAIISSLRGLEAAAIDNIGPRRSKGRQRPMGKLFTVFYAQKLFLRYRADKPTNYDSGDFVKLCKLIWEIATGESEAEFKRQIQYVFNKKLRFSPPTFGAQIAENI